MKYLLLLFLIWTSLSYSPQPVPTCNPPSVTLKDVPITLHETQLYNVNDFFTGFNLQYNLSSSAPAFAFFRKKFSLEKTTAISQPGLKSYHLQHRGNTWGKDLITLSEEGNATKIRWGSTTPNETFPVLHEEVTVQNEEGITCFDAVLLKADHIAMVDCVKKVTFGVKNIFLYVNTTSQTIIGKIVENDMYVGFTTITKRKMFIFESDDFRYLARSYFEHGVDQAHKHNTYMEVMTFNDPMKPRTIKVIDRSFLHEQKLSITDFKIYYGSIYLLDYNNGVSVFGVTKSQHVLIEGRYRSDSGFKKLGIYAGNLDHQIILALANDHAIYEIDFSNQLRPEIIAKYNLMHDAEVTSLWLNGDYVIAQVYANVTDAKNDTVEYNSSIIFSRGTRTYLNAYAIVQHKSERVIVDFNREHNTILIMDEQTLNGYQLDTPILSINPSSKDYLGKQFVFSINALSVNTYSGAQLACSFTMRFQVVDLDDKKMYPTGFTLPEAYYANYPGQLFIPLERYVIGPNITWGVKEWVGEEGNLSTSWILQQNTTILHWQRDPSFFKITFLRQEQYDSIAETDLFIYTQDFTNKTHFVKCTTVPFTKNVTCEDDGYIAEVNHKILNLTANRFHYYEGKYIHLVAIVYESLPNEIFIYEAEDRTQFARPIIFPKGYEGQIQSIQFLGEFLAVVLRYTKEIVFFDMVKCADHQERECVEEGRIDSILMDQLGVKFFAPLQIYTSDDYPYVLFIQNIESVIIIDVVFPRPTLLAQIHSPGSMQPGLYKWKMAIAKHHLILVNPPNVIQEHSLLQLIAKKGAPMLRNYPLYSYTIPDKFDLDFSDAGDMIYITAEDKNLPQHMNSVILVYRAGLPSVAAFYDVFHINGKYQDILIDATGNFGDYISVALGSMLTMFRQYQVPILVFDDSFSDFQFNITYTNDPEQTYHYLAKSSVKISNFPEDIVVNDSRLNDSDFLSSQFDYQNEYVEVVLNDSGWFKGNIINYTVEECDQCGQKLRVVNHVQDNRDLLASMDMDDYVFNQHGGVIQQFQSMISMQHNGSINQYISMPAVHDGENCRHITYSFFYDFAVSACHHNEQVYLYLTQFHSNKPFVNGPHVSSAKSIASLQIMEDLFIIVDVDENPGVMSREGGIIVYSLNHDTQNPQLFDELQFIDTMDLMTAQGWGNDQVYISNAHLVYTNQSETYRLAITQVKNGLFFVDFKWRRGKKSVEITKVQYYNMNEELVKSHLPLPNMAFFENVAINHEFYDPIFKYWEVQLIVTTRNFHIFEVFCNFDKTGTLLNPKITHVYYRYGFYETSNYLKVFDGYFAVVQKIPILYEQYPWYSKQVLTVYDTRERFKPPTVKQEGIPASYMLGGMAFPMGRITFDFNFTFERNSSHPLRHVGLLVLHARQATIKQIAIHDNFRIVAEQGLSNSQYAIFRANNEFSHFEIPLDVIVHGSLAGWAIALIVIACLVVAAVGGFIGWKIFLKKKKSKSEIKKSLLEKQGETDQDDDDEQEEEDDEDDEEDEESESDEAVSGGQKEEEIPVVKAVEKPKEPVSINRETITSVDAEERKDEESLEQIEEKKEE